MAEPRIPAEPTEARLHEAALAYLARYASSKANVIRVLDRRVARWARAVACEEPERIAAHRAAVRRVANRLEAAGLIDDVAFAELRARSLRRAGRSGRAVAAHLGARGIDSETRAAVVPSDPAAELIAALILTRRRKLGPFRDPECDADRLRELGILARAGFSQHIARTALAMDKADALHRIEESRSL